MSKQGLRRKVAEHQLRAIWQLPAGYLPARINALDDKAVVALASDEELRAKFEEIERRRVGKDWEVFLAGYVSHSPGEGTGRAPLTPWDWQMELGAVMGTGEPLIVLKRRQVGVSLLISAYAVWTAGLNEESKSGRVLIISKEARSAKRVLKECRKQIGHLPYYLRPEAGEKFTNSVTGLPCQDSTEELEFARGASIASFPPTAGGRGETASLAIVDEAAVFEGSADPDETISAVLPAADHGQLILVSTGNGRGAKGAKYASLWDSAAAGELPWQTFFIDRTMHPDWSDEWAKRTLLAMGEAKFKREYPASPGEALDGDAEGKAYDRDGVMAAIKAGDNIDGKQGEVFLGIDYGGIPSAVVIRANRRMIFEVVGEYVAEGPSPDPDAFILSAIELADRYGQLETIYFDSADRNVIAPTVGRLAPRLRTHAVVFSKSKRPLVGFLRHLLSRTKEEEDYGVIAIADSCENLKRQLLSLEQDDEGKVKKGDDHAHDALLCALREPMSRWERTHRQS